MNKEMYKHITGITEFHKCFSDKNWFYFQKMLEFRWYKYYDYEEWSDKYCIDITLSDSDEKDCILLRLINVRGKCEFVGEILGLEIINLRYNASYLETHYEVRDFEEENIQLYCDDIEVKVLCVKGVKVD